MHGVPFGEGLFRACGQPGSGHFTRQSAHKGTFALPQSKRMLFEFKSNANIATESTATIGIAVQIGQSAPASSEARFAPSPLQNQGAAAQLLLTPPLKRNVPMITPVQLGVFPITLTFLQHYVCESRIICARIDSDILNLDDSDFAV